MISSSPRVDSMLSGFTGLGLRALRHAVIASALVYVAAWLAGLAGLLTGADPHAGAAQVSMVLADNATAAVIQSWLVHGVAAIALLCLVGSALADAGTGSTRTHRQHRDLVGCGRRGRGVPAAGGLPAHRGRRGDTSDPGHHRNLVPRRQRHRHDHTGAARDRRRWPDDHAGAVGAGPWFGWPALSLAGLVPLAGLAFVCAAPVLGGMLAASLVLLLGWALVAAVFTVRLSEPADGSAAVVESKREKR